MYDSYYELYTGASLVRMDALLQGHSCTHLSKQKPSPLWNSLLIALKGSIWGALIEQPPHWGALNAPSHSHGTLFTRNSHVVDTFVQRRPQDVCHETINWTPSRRAFNSLTRSSCLKFRNVNQVIFWHIFANTSVYWFTFLLKHIRNWKR